MSKYLQFDRKRSRNYNRFTKTFTRDLYISKSLQILRDNIFNVYILLDNKYNLSKTKKVAKIFGIIIFYTMTLTYL